MEIDSDRESVEGASDFSSGEADASDDETVDLEEVFNRDLRRVINNDHRTTVLEGYAHDEFTQNITNERWEEIGRDISNNTYLKELELNEGTLNDDKASYLFRGLTGSSSLKELGLYRCGLSIAVVRSMVPFLQNATNLRILDLEDNNDLQSEGFNFLVRALRGSPIEELWCNACGIESIEIELDHFPRQLKSLSLGRNNINTDGCRGVAQLLQGGDSTLVNLDLSYNNIADEGVAILVGALRRNATLETFNLRDNGRISKEGLVMLLKLVNDISNVKATLESNHTLKDIDAIKTFSSRDPAKHIQRLINTATIINASHVGNPEAAGTEKMIQTQLNSARREALAELQGVDKSVYSEINPLHLPEVLSLVGRRHGRGELFLALKSSIAGVISVVNERQCILQRLAYHEAKAAEARAELAQFDAVGRDRDAIHVGNEACSNKRPRIDD